MNIAMFRQARLRLGQAERIGWLRAEPRLRIGVEVTLDGISGRWRVVQLGGPLPETAIHHGWNVGGIEENPWR